jgi:hypothetical protein
VNRIARRAIMCMMLIAALAVIWNLLALMSDLTRIPNSRQTSRHVRKPAQQRKSRLFDHLVATGEHLAAMVIRAARSPQSFFVPREVCTPIRAH